MKVGYVYIWEYNVRPESMPEFERLYGPEGAWVELFRRQDGYVRTELYRDTKMPGRYVTIDYWRSEEDCRTFRRVFASEFEALDDRGERLTVAEDLIGEFSPVRSSGDES